MGEKRVAEEGESLGGDRLGKLLLENITESSPPVGDEQVRDRKSVV